MSDELRTIPIHSALVRHSLLAGCERELVLMSGATSLILIVILGTWFAAGFGVVFWLFCYFVLRKMGKADPLMSKVYLRHIKYKKFYPAHSTPFAPSFKHKPWG